MDESTLTRMMQFPLSALANHYLKDKRGIEIGGSYHNRFGLKTLNVDYTDKFTIFKQEEVKICGLSMNVDIVAEGDDLPFKDNVWDFVINSHVLEHFFDPINAIEEWMRVIKPGGYLFMIIPHKERTFDNVKERTTLAEIIERHKGNIPLPPFDENYEGDVELYYRCIHHNIWITEDVLELCKYMNLNVVDYQDVDDKVGNGFTIVIRKED